MAEPTRVILGMAGASGAALGLRIAERLAALGSIETHLVATPSAQRTIAHELGADGWPRLTALARVVHDNADIGASIASGSFPVAGMVVAPCSIRSLSAIAHCQADSLLTRAADVRLKEGQKLLLMVRETPLHLGHLRLMVAASEAGAVIMPPMPAFYHLPADVAAIVDQLAARAIDLMHLPIPLQARRWEGG